MRRIDSNPIFSRIVYLHAENINLILYEDKGDLLQYTRAGEAS
jgi:hypothetical protein